MSTSWSQFGTHLVRMRKYLAQSKLSQEMERLISWNLDLQDGTYRTGAGYPERREYINEKDRLDITSRRTQLISGFPFHKEEFDWLRDEADGLQAWKKNTQGTIKELDARVAVLNLKLQDPDHILNSQANQEKRLPASQEKILMLARSGSAREERVHSPDKSGLSKGSDLSLAGLCLASADDTPENVAERINFIWNKLPDTAKVNRRSRIPNDSRAAAAAVFKFMQHLGKIDSEPSATVWTAVLLQEWGVAVSPGIARYRIENNNNVYFVRAVSAALKLVKDYYAIWLKSSELLPDRYYQKHVGKLRKGEKAMS